MPRDKSRTSVSIEVMLDFSSGRREARVSDLSLTGCFVDSIVAVSEGEIVSISLKISDEGWLILKGEVVYIFQGTGFGVRFIELSENDLQLLEQAIVKNGGNPWSGDETAG